LGGAKRIKNYCLAQKERGRIMALTLHSQTRFGHGPTTQRIEHTIALPNGETLSLSSFGRSHSLSVEVLEAAEAVGEPYASLGSRQVNGAMPHQAIDKTITLHGYRVHVKGWGRSHSVYLK